MPMPHGSYIQTKKIEKIRLRAPQAKQKYREHVSGIKRPPLRKFDIRTARYIAYLAKDFGSEPTAKGETVRKALADLVDQLNEMSEEIETLSQTHTELREPHFEYRAVTHGHATVSAVNFLHIAMASITLLMVLERVIFGKSGQQE